VLKFVNEMSP